MEEGIWASLACLLEQQNQMLVRLIELGQQELTALKNNDLDKLQQVTREQEQVSRELVLLERARSEVEKELGRGLNIGGSFALRDVLPHAGRQESALREIAEKIRANYLQLVELNETNRLLIRQSLSYVNRMLRALVPADGVTYTAAGQVASKVDSQGLVDKTV